MARRYVNQHGPQQAVDEVFIASGKQLRTNRNGNLYLQVSLSDRTGTMAARMWNAKESVYQSFENGDYVRVLGSTQLFQGSIQLIATKLTKVNPGEVNEEDFVQLTPVDVDRLANRLREILRGIVDPNLANLAECFLLDEELMKKYTLAPAGIKNHHAYQGGLLEHVVNMMEVAIRIAPYYPQINKDLLLMGIFLHDISKIDELSYNREMIYTDEGQLIGHLVMAVSLLEKKVAETEKLSNEPIAPDIVLRLKHMIVSHHGKYEFGSPKLPMTIEAEALHHIDNLDSKIFTFDQLMRDDLNADSPWTCYNSNLGRKFFKGKKGG